MSFLSGLRSRKCAVITSNAKAETRTPKCFHRTNDTVLGYHDPPNGTSSAEAACYQTAWRCAALLFPPGALCRLSGNAY
jgi:hypothetical protein